MGASLFHNPDGVIAAGCSQITAIRAERQRVHAGGMPHQLLMQDGGAGVPQAQPIAGSSKHQIIWIKRQMRQGTCRAGQSLLHRRFSSISHPDVVAGDGSKTATIRTEIYIQDRTGESICCLQYSPVMTSQIHRRSSYGRSCHFSPIRTELQTADICPIGDQFLQHPAGSNVYQTSLVSGRNCNNLTVRTVGDCLDIGRRKFSENLAARTIL